MSGTGADLRGSQPGTCRMTINKLMLGEPILRVRAVPESLPIAAVRLANSFLPYVKYTNDRSRCPRDLPG
ncbi:hypothetical protein EV191_12444 [Tamaricihabitans halophyticus]|uniref:Uncharacterized protein n=1 Tax=Tamaricihabitans halophyticus TaxID=1262583 RepID=A0A4R2Q321_9PSEU|nr:hypothetical protein EV191_12444 [Tamaricihabitans halophyticus]